MEKKGRGNAEEIKGKQGNEKINYEFPLENGVRKIMNRYLGKKNREVVDFTHACVVFVKRTRFCMNAVNLECVCNVRSKLNSYSLF